MGETKLKEDWKCVIVNSGVQFVTTYLHLLMPELSAGSLAMKVTELLVLINDSIYLYFFDKGLAIKLPAIGNFGVGDGEIWLDDVSCVGDENSIFDCKSLVNNDNCQHSEDVGLQCSNDTLLGKV